MPNRAYGTNCPNCGTLTACAGNHTDARLIGRCACCGRTVTMHNYDIMDGKFVVVSEPEPKTKPQPAPSSKEKTSEVPVDVVS